MRSLPILLVAGLLACTAAAFAVTENLKLERSPILRTRVDKLFAPGCECERQRARIDFRLRRADDVTLTIVDANGNVVRTLAARSLRPGFHHFTWDGRDDQNRVVEDAIFRPRIHLAKQRRTILLPNPIHADTTSPQASLVSLLPRVISPDRDGRRDSLTARYTSSEPSRVRLYVNGKLRARTRPFLKAGDVRWPRGRIAPLRAGRYRIQLAAEDLAGNEGSLTPVTFLRVRYITLARGVIRARAGRPFAVGVSTDANRYRWRIGPRSGLRRARRLVLMVPAPGTYLLVVSFHGHSDRARLIVGPPL
ncbi:MAG: hypothetical protein M3R70_13945 [Actinomycetota bacterium]|nr:hypothetical protein [Actinomycetota bacterium]